MYFRTILSGTLAAMLLSAAAASARDAAPAMADHGIAVQRPAAGLPGVFGQPRQQESFQLAQASDPRVVALEEQIRALNGTVEELNFQILQLQEQLRKMQEDNEFRFQELEKRSDARSGKSNRTTAAAPPAANGGSGQPSSVEDVIAGEAPGTTNPNAGAPDGTLGTITVDKDGNVKVLGDSGPPGGTAPAAGSGATPAPGGNGSIVAALPPTDDPEELYRNSYQFILSGDYATAETGFRDHIERFPQNERASDAHFWLGEALLGQKKYRDAAETFLAASKQYPKSKKGPDMLLKLGVSLVGLKQRDVACATFGEVGKRYPNASAALKERVKQEQAQAAC
ncbi:tol-pal system protein YbgF [Kumtagia ephedrae]|uniref:Cell division coordinator CpoB n=1 Tax=Kumtagia ephedrae TaxID=2116701 RepID=A0A2P7S486_9HYPH|nr:tol-pal system protein YbgF [Mesorhizobium ephedrae]PSJ57272.1 tol-pal system protein YbgF [Mesorhizobium ephedrae]